MTSYAERPPVEATAKPRKRSRSRRAAWRRPLAGGVLWIAALTVLLGGVVAINVAVLQLNVRFDELGRERVKLRDDNARLRSELSSAGANARIEMQARSRLGLVEADQSMTSYVDLAPER
jgi:cell division protein FtsL